MNQWFQEVHRCKDNICVVDWSQKAPEVERRIVCRGCPYSSSGIQPASPPPHGFAWFLMAGTDRRCIHR
jgi:hypothetical protein